MSAFACRSLAATLGRKGRMEITPGKLLALAVALAYVIGSLVLTREWRSCVGLAVIMLFPLSLIWFPDHWGEHVAGRITKETPPLIVALGGWILLIGLPAVLFWIATNSVDAR